MADTRAKNWKWAVLGEDGKCSSVQHAQLAVLMDIRDELQHLNGTLDCPNFRMIPRRLARISSNTANLPKVAKKKAVR